MMDAIAFSSVVLCDDVSVTVRFAVPFDQESPKIVRMVALPFLSTSVAEGEFSYFAFLPQVAIYTMLLNREIGRAHV